MIPDCASAGSVTSLGLHVVWCPMCRRPVLHGQWRGHGGLVSVVTRESGGGGASEVMADHVHLFVRVRPTDSPAQAARLVKGRTSRVWRREFPWLCHNRALWSTSYFAASVGYVSEATVTRSLEHQWDDPQ